MLLGLTLIDPQVAIGAFILFGTAYSLLAVKTRLELKSNSSKISIASSSQQRSLQEGLGAIRDVLLDGTQPWYLHIYENADRLLRKLQAKNSFLSISPRFIFEAMGMVAIAFLGGYLVLQRTSNSAVVPLLGAIALGAQRLLPSFQQIFSGWSALKGHHSSIEDVLKDLDQPLPEIIRPIKPFRLQKEIRLKGLSFRYGQDLPVVLDDIDIEISAGQRIGFVGSTGSGKSTIADLIMGLLRPSSGHIYVDGIALHSDSPERLAAWRSIIAHVPQSIYLSDSSIAENIAFGVAKQNIDMKMVHKAAQLAQISEFIEDMPEGYGSFVGERGVRLSGGQRQRIGIARALYKQAQILVLDEATSALDNSTEQAVMSAVDGLSRKLTILIIAHRLTTIQRCDRVIKLQHGKVIYNGKPDAFLDV